MGKVRSVSMTGQGPDTLSQRVAAEEAFGEITLTKETRRQNQQRVHSTLFEDGTVETGTAGVLLRRKKRS